MNASRFREIAGSYPRLRVGVVGDFCLDRYFEIDPAKEEISIETGLPVHNVVKVRSQPGAAGTIVNNLVALGVGEIYPVGFCGEDAEGFDLSAALNSGTGVRLDHFLRTSGRRTFTYCKPLVVTPGKTPRELNRFDFKNWSPTPDGVREILAASFHSIADKCDAIILMDQVDVPETGVLTADMLVSVGRIASARPDLLMIGDSRRSLRYWPPICLKMNKAELALLTGGNCNDIAAVRERARSLAREQSRSVFVTQAEHGIVGASPVGEIEHVPALPVRGEIDIVGAGDSVTANLTAALAAGATLRESCEIAMAAASVVVHQLGTTGTASAEQIARLLPPGP